MDTDGLRPAGEEILLDLSQKWLSRTPQLAVGDGFLGFWNALMKVYPSTAQQSCWEH